MRKFMLLMFVFVFVLAGYANADTVTVWTGDVSFVVKTTSTDEDSSGNIKFKTESQRSEGKIQTFIGENGPVGRQFSTLLTPRKMACYLQGERRTMLP